MDQGLWFIMFSNSRVVLDDVAVFLQQAQDWDVSIMESQARAFAQRYVQVVYGEHVITIGLNDAPAVLQESREIAEMFAPESQRAQVGACDRRFEVAYELRADMANFNPVCRVEQTLRAFLGSGAFTFMPLEQIFITERASDR